MDHMVRNKKGAAISAGAFFNFVSGLVVASPPRSSITGVRVVKVPVSTSETSVSHLCTTVLSIVLVTVVGLVVISPAALTRMITLPILTHLIVPVVRPVPSLSTSICRESDKCGGK